MSFTNFNLKRKWLKPKILCECLYQAFAPDVFRKIAIDDFLSSIAVLVSLERSLVMRFLFRVYDVRSTGAIERSKVDKLLAMAYGERMKSDSEFIKRQLDYIFRNSNHHDKETLSLKEFESCKGNTE